MNCAREGCTGTILDGYCDVCGMAPAPRAAPSSPAAVLLPAPPAPASGPVGHLPPPSALTVSASGTARRATTGRTRTSARGRLGAGLVEIPPVPFRDPADAVLGDSAMVPESRRFCGRCNEPVGRGRDGEPGRTAGFCRKCGGPFSFEPKLHAGELVADQYEAVGCLAHGGMGWVYLARDRNVSDRWVVLKGLLNAGDDDAMAAALAERRFLAEVEHPNIVKIFNFVQQDSSGYIVMEYVGGRSLKQILAARREANGGEADPLPPTQAIAYMLEILPALGYLHQLGLLFCDFKIDNVIQTQHSLKLIDLGGVCRMDDPSSAVFGTVGYQAPEIAAAGPSIASDLFTVARTLAVLCFDFRGYQSTYRFTLPPQESVPLLARYDSLYRFLLAGAAPDPDDRFQSAEEMADQLYGVLREIVADQEGHAVPAPSKLFSGALRGGHEWPDWRIAWTDGLRRLATGDADAAGGAFSAVYDELPGELAPKLALGMASEATGDERGAASWYDIVSRTDPAFTAATFGLARCLLHEGERDGALAAYDRVPEAASAYVEAQTARIHCLRTPNGSADGRAAELLAAGEILEALPIRGEQRARLKAELLEAALEMVQRREAFDDGRTNLLGHRFLERDLRLGVETSYRELARWASSSTERIELVDRANEVRPRTWT